MPGEEPFSRPTPEATDGGEGLDHLVVRVAGEGVEVQLARGDPTRETNDVLGLAGGELHAAQLAHGRASESRCARESVHGVRPDLDGRPVAPNETRAHGEGEGEIDLLGAHRAHEHLEWPRLEGGPKAVQARDKGAQHRVRGGLPVEPLDVQIETAEVARLDDSRIEHARAPGAGN